MRGVIWEVFGVPSPRGRCGDGRSGDGIVGAVGTVDGGVC
jgi:hypothetical protein